MQGIKETLDKYMLFPLGQWLSHFLKKVSVFLKPTKSSNSPDKCMYVHIWKFAYSEGSGAFRDP